MKTSYKVRPGLCFAKSRSCTVVRAMLIRNYAIFMIVSNKFSLFRSRNASTFRRTKFVFTIYCSQSNRSRVRFRARRQLEVGLLYIFVAMIYDATTQIFNFGSIYNLEFARIDGRKHLFSNFDLSAQFIENKNGSPAM